MIRIKSKTPISEVPIDTTAECPYNSIITLLPETSKENTRKHYLFQTVNETYQIEIIEDVHIEQLKPAQLQAIHEHNPMDDFDTTGHSPLNLRAEQQKDSDIKSYPLVRKRPTDNWPIYPNIYTQDPLCLGECYTESSTTIQATAPSNNTVFQFTCGRKYFSASTSVWSGHKGVSRTIAEVRKRFYFPNFT